MALPQQEVHITRCGQFDPRNDLVLGSIRIGMGCMNLVTVISRCIWVPVTLISIFSSYTPSWFHPFQNGI